MIGHLRLLFPALRLSLAFEFIAAKMDTVSDNRCDDHSCQRTNTGERLILDELVDLAGNSDSKRQEYDRPRGAARTRASLHHALISLILTKGYDSITVDEICQTANVGRSTFYLHYTSKDDLKKSGLDGLRRQLAETAAHVAHGDRPSPSLGFSLAMFEHARGHVDLYRALAGGRGGTVALGTIRKILSDLVRDETGGKRRQEFSGCHPARTCRSIRRGCLYGRAHLVAGWGHEAATRSDRCDVSSPGDRGRNGEGPLNARSPDTHFRTARHVAIATQGSEHRATAETPTGQASTDDRGHFNTPHWKVKWHSSSLPRGVLKRRWRSRTPDRHRGKR